MALAIPIRLVFVAITVMHATVVGLSLSFFQKGLWKKQETFVDPIRPPIRL